MYISIKESHEKVCLKWSDVHPRPSNDNPGNVAVADALVKPLGARHEPWLVPGVGNTF